MGKVVTVGPVELILPISSVRSITQHPLKKSVPTQFQDKNTVALPNKPSQTCLFGNWLLND